MTYNTQTYRPQNIRSNIRAWTKSDVNCSSGQKSNGSWANEKLSRLVNRNAEDAPRHFLSIIRHV